MTGYGHTLSGFVAGIPLVVTVFQASQNATAVVAALACCTVGATAPDWLEIPYSSTSRGKNGQKIKVTKRLLKHRGVTHVASFWILAFLWAFFEMKAADGASMASVGYSALVGFFAGGIIHLLGDLPNRRQIHMFTPFDGVSLNLWESGNYEKTTVAIITAVVGLFAWNADYLYELYNPSVFSFF